MPTKIHLPSTLVAGTKYRANKEELSRFVQALDHVTLTREPNNEFDSNALACYIGSRHVGYIPATIAKYLSPLIDNGLVFSAFVEKVLPLKLSLWIIPVWEKPTVADEEFEFYDPTETEDDGEV